MCVNEYSANTFLILPAEKTLPNKSLEPTRLSRVRLDGGMGFGAFRFMLDVTASAARRLSSNPFPTFTFVTPGGRNT